MESGEGVRAETSQSADYGEISLTPISFGPYRDAARWDFAVEGLRKVDYYFVSCNIGFAVLGAAPPSEFGSLVPTFHEMADSVSPRYCE